MAKRAKPETVDAKPLFEWIEADEKNRKALRAAKYSEGRTGNWRKRGIPRGEVPAIAQLMRLTFDQYLDRAGVPVNAVQQTRAEYLATPVMLADFNALQVAFKEHVARKISQLRRYADSLSPILRDGVQRPPADPNEYVEWQLGVETELARLEAQIGTPAPLSAVSERARDANQRKKPDGKNKKGTQR